MFLIEIVFVDSKKLFIVRQPDGRPLLSSFDLAEASAFIDEHSNLPKSQYNNQAD